MPVIKFLHVILGVTLSGLVIANYFYLSLCIREKNKDLLTFALRLSLFLDCLFFLPVILILFTTGSFQVLRFNFTFNTPWIISAYVFFILFTFLWLLLFSVKSYNYVSSGQQKTFFLFKKTFHLSYLISILCLLFIIHDAVRKMTFIPWEHFIK